MNERLSPRRGNGTSGPPEIRGARVPRSPMLDRIERGGVGDDPYTLRKAVRHLLILLGVAAIPAAAGGLYAVYRDLAPTTPPLSAGPCRPGENHLDCVDRRHAEEVGSPYVPILPGLDRDGCSILSPEDRLRSSLCCSHVSPNPENCPQPVPGMGLSVEGEGGDFVILDADSFIPGGRGAQGGGVQ